MAKFFQVLCLFLTIFVTLESAWAQITPRIEDGLAITHPRVLGTMEQRLNGVGIGLGYYLDPTGRSTPKLSNKFLAELPVFQTILRDLESELALFQRSFTSNSDTAGVGLNFHNRMFDIRFLKEDRAVLSLIGVVNRMDQGYKNSATCGETRLIYRLAYSVELPSDQGPKRVSSRLPMTVNLILNARPANSSLSCADIARRWKNININGLSVTQAVDSLFSDEGPLSPELRDRSLIKQLEINLQLSRKAAAVSPDFGGHAVYLLKVYGWNAQQQTFSPILLDNQVDRQKSEAFFTWLLAPANLQQNLTQLDQGTLRIPETFLAPRAYSIAPGGLGRAQNHVLFNTLSDDKIQTALSQWHPPSPRNILSVDGFKRRLTDMSCTGCHQTRAIGGFHFMGQDPYRWNPDNSSFSGLYPGNAVIVPASAHFFADLERRRRIVDAISLEQPVDYASGFSSKPDGSNSRLYTNWGAHCYVGHDPSFKQWTCSAQYQCLQLHQSPLAPGMGVCVSKTLKEIGDPTETGRITLTGRTWYSDAYNRQQTFSLPNDKDYVNSPQSAQSGSKTGGFPGGSIRTKTCDPTVMSRHPEALCGALPAAKSGFNACLTDPKQSFKDCIDEYSTGVGLRGCSRRNPCRDDYICAEPLNSKDQDAGVCVPPYFLFQFRVDGHPIRF